MDIIQLLLKEFNEETGKTRRMLERIPEDKWDWKPHEKSMVFKYLVVHLAELPGWVTMALTTTELDFATAGYKPSEVSSREDVLNLHQASVEKGRSSLENAKEEDLLPGWTLRKGEQIFMTMTKYEVIRHALAQTIHHRAQLGVYLRLMDIPIPGTYGPSADEGF
jgi:uncharacterized damage-inducible protein DinB